MKTAPKVIRIAVAAVVVCVFLFIVYVLIMLGGSDYREYPYERAALWVCEEPEMTLDFSNERHIGYLKWNGEEYLVSVGTKAGYFSIDQIDPEEVSIPMIEEQDLLFSGRWHFEGENLIVTITKDRIFGDAYQTIVFTPQE